MLLNADSTDCHKSNRRHRKPVFTATIAKGANGKQNLTAEDAESAEILSRTKSDQQSLVISKI